MTHRALVEVRARLEEMDARLAALEPSTDPQAVYDRYEQLAIAILDRLLHHATTINIKGESYWLKEKRKAGLLGKTKPTSASRRKEEAPN